MDWLVDPASKEKLKKRKKKERTSKRRPRNGSSEQQRSDLKDHWSTIASVHNPRARPACISFVCRDWRNPRCRSSPLKRCCCYFYADRENQRRCPFVTRVTPQGQSSQWSVLLFFCSLVLFFFLFIVCVCTPGTNEQTPQTCNRNYVNVAHKGIMCDGNSWDRGVKEWGAGVFRGLKGGFVWCVFAKRPPKKKKINQHRNHIFFLFFVPCWLIVPMAGCVNE